MFAGRAANEPDGNRKRDAHQHCRNAHGRGSFGEVAADERHPRTIRRKKCVDDRRRETEEPQRGGGAQGEHRLRGGEPGRRPSQPVHKRCRNGATQRDAREEHDEHAREGIGCRPGKKHERARPDDFERQRGRSGQCVPPQHRAGRSGTADLVDRVACWVGWVRLGGHARSQWVIGDRRRASLLLRYAEGFVRRGDRRMASCNHPRGHGADKVAGGSHPCRLEGPEPLDQHEPRRRRTTHGPGGIDRVEQTGMPREASGTPFRQHRHHGRQRSAHQERRRCHRKRRERKACDAKPECAGLEQASDMR